MKTLTVALILLVSFVLVFLVAPAHAQDVVNPSEVRFELSVDHSLVTSYEVDLVDSSGAIEATIPLGKPTGVAGQDVTVSINVQPITFGTYTGVFRAVFDPTIASVDVPATNNAIRQPGGPSNPRFAEVVGTTQIVIG